jgi:hypothetical protein
MAEAQQEKRAARRFALRIPVSVARDDNSKEYKESAQIRDVSARGICLYLNAPESIRVQCKGRVVRIEDGNKEGKMAVAAVIEEYEFLPES